MIDWSKKQWYRVEYEYTTYDGKEVKHWELIKATTSVEAEKEFIKSCPFNSNAKVLAYPATKLT